MTVINFCGDNNEKQKRFVTNYINERKQLEMAYMEIEWPKISLQKRYLVL
mgnify:CR=1 FL=1